MQDKLWETNTSKLDVSIHVYGIIVANCKV